MVKIIEEINKVISKIDENTSEKLSQSEAQKLLLIINKGLIEVKKNAEENQKEIVDKKVEELRGKIDENLSDEGWMWGATKVLLNDDIKGGLEELKNEIIELEKSQKIFAAPIITINEPTIGIGKKEIEELAEWKNAFPGQNAKFVLERINKLEADLTKENSQNLSIIDKIRGGKDKSSFTAQISERATGAMDEQAEATKKVIETAGGLAPVLTPLAGAANFVGAYTHAGAIAVAGAAEFVGTTGVAIVGEVIDKVDDARKDLKDHIEVHAENAKELAEKGMDNAADVAKEFFDIFKGSGTLEAKLESAKELMGRAEKELSELKKQIDELKAENKETLERQAKEYKKQIDELKVFYNEALEKKDVENKELQKRLDELTNKGQDNLMAVIGQLTKGGSNSSSGGQ